MDHDCGFGFMDTGRKKRKYEMKKKNEKRKKGQK